MLAAAALHALDHHIDRLADDHARARRLAEGLQALPGLTVETPQTNLVFVNVEPRVAHGLVDRLAALGLQCNGLYRLRLATHLDVNDADVDSAIDCFARALRA